MKFLFLSTFSNETLIEETLLHCLKSKIEVVRINLEDLIPHPHNNLRIAVKDDDVLIAVDKKVHLLSEFSLVWQRRISNNFLSGERVFASYGDSIPKTLCRQLINEVYEVRDLLLHFFEYLEIPVINNYDHVCRSKPFQSIKAKEFGLNSPSIMVSNSVDELSSFIKAQDSITKTIGGVGYINDEDQVLSLGTTKLDEGFTKDISTETTFPSFVQQLVKSKYELKCILVGDELYCIKQFSPDGDIPTTDIKQALSNNLIKKEQYHLEESVKEKVIKLCQSFNLELCTVDIIYSDQEEYVFIEINPDGIVEYYGSYLDKNIHEVIFRWLLKRARQITE